MNKGVSLLVTILLISVLVSCEKDNMGENCFVCSNEVQSIDVCEEDGNFVVDGDVIENANGVSLEDLIRAIEANEENDPSLEGVTCTRM